MLFLLILTTALAQNPSAPQWPNVYALSFLEDTFSVYGVNQVSGTVFYNYSLGTTRVDRSNGRYDRFCSLNEWFLFFDTPCTQLVNNGIRYLIYPELQVCCNCCSASDGCGVVKPTWLQNATYTGTHMYNGTIPSYSWLTMSFEPVFYQETQDPAPLNRFPLEIDIGPSDKFMFASSNSWNTSFSSNVFNVPTYCQSQYMCDSSSLCGQVRGSGGKSELLKYLVG
ncbi:hypothetical protein SteCoe_23809 [Stentor coeruleus]|uniref:Uncharacterized protein n=1 Tax=Stentor coeruleus TaxID=5963 RepID=A0A1R2BIY5_9CILI|nr:hypothetical protein SteCoe_23809 [Stentor coeruleus]